MSKRGRDHANQRRNAGAAHHALTAKAKQVTPSTAHGITSILDRNVDGAWKDTALMFAESTDTDEKLLCFTDKDIGTTKMMQVRPGPCAFGKNTV